MKGLGGTYGGGAEKCYSYYGNAFVGMPPLVMHFCWDAPIGNAFVVLAYQ